MIINQIGVQVTATGRPKFVDVLGAERVDNRVERLVL